MAPPRIWPRSAEERADRHTVVTLIERVGREQLRFTVSDLRKRLLKEPQLTLYNSKDLSRHVAYLESARSLLIRVGARFDTGTSGPVSRSKHTFVLTNRMREYEAGHATLEFDDVERVRLALWVAFDVCGRAVPTRSVTQVLRNIRPLAVNADYQTSLFLQTLAGRAEPLVEKITVPGQRWVQWRPLGARPELRELDDWVQEAAEVLSGERDLTCAGHATKNELLREIVEIAVRKHSSPSWPAGRSVTVSDIRAVIKAHERAGALNGYLKRIGASLGPLLGDVSKASVAGRQRVDQRVVKVSNPWTEATYYDVPGLPGYESRCLVVSTRGLASLFSATARHELNLEYAGALALTRADDRVAAAIGAARLLCLQHRLDLIGEAIHGVKSAANLLSDMERDRLAVVSADYGHFRMTHGTTAEALDQATKLLESLGLVAAEVLAVDRPLLTGTEYSAWFPPYALGKRTPAQFLALARSLARYQNPRFVARTHADPVSASPTGVDRAEALVYAAQQHHSPMAAFLAGGAALLGKFLRDARLPALLLESDDMNLRHQGLAALALLGDEGAYDAAAAALSNGSGPFRPRDAVHALMVLRRYSRDLVGPAQRRSDDLGFLRAVTMADRAADEGRWLLQR